HHVTRARHLRRMRMHSYCPVAVAVAKFGRLGSARFCLVTKLKVDLLAALRL
ncbi:hypothetical protein HK100_007366, partial [Physocladia obscura]